MNSDTGIPTIKSLHDELVAQSQTSVGLVEASFRVIEEHDEVVNSFIDTYKDTALEHAHSIDRRFKAGEDLSALAGIPFSVKDAFSVQGMFTRSASKVLEGYRALFTATPIGRLLERGAILLGKNNQDAFGFGSSTEHSDYGTTVNPWHTDMVAGGSSGGSAAAVAAGMGVFSIGEDTGGSIRLPANFCGVSGLKVTYGRVSRYGAVAFASSLDTVGPIARSVEDIAIIMEAIAGKDEYDATTLPHPVPSYTDLLSQRADLAGLTFGVPEEFIGDTVDGEIREAFERAADVLVAQGAVRKDVSMPFTKHGVGAYYVTAPSEASSNLSRYDGIRYGFSDRTGNSLESTYTKSRTQGFNDEVQRRVMLGTYALSAGYYDAYFNKAQQIRTLMKQEYEDVFNEVDFLLAPVAPVLPFKIGDKSQDPLALWLIDVFTIPVNIAGVPSLAMPCGFSTGNLPIGMQVIGPQLSEDLLLQIGYVYQKETDWHEKQPELLSANI